MIQFHHSCVRFEFARGKMAKLWPTKTSFFPPTTSSLDETFCSDIRVNPVEIAIRAAIVLLLAVAFAAGAETTNAVSSAEIQGRELAGWILAQQPSENSTNCAVLKIRKKKKRKWEIPIQFRVQIATPSTNAWQSCYETTDTNRSCLTITHSAGQPNQYHLIQNGKPSDLDNDAPAVSFAGSDFWNVDFGLEFLSWPEQRIMKKEFHNNCPTAVLESINPRPIAGTYSRVVSRIDENSGGVMEAQAFDLTNRMLKEFRVKDLRKVNGRWQVEAIEMLNVQTDSHTRLEFNLKP